MAPLNKSGHIVSKVNSSLVQKDKIVQNPLDKNGNEKKEILYDGYYYDVTEWAKIHPGGNIINFYTEKGEDATVAIGQFHHRSSKRVKAIMSSLKRRPANPQDFKDFDEETLRKHRELTHDFTKLYRELEVEGVFEPSMWHVAFRHLEIIALTALGLYLTVIRRDSLMCQILGTLVLGLVNTRCGWLMHEGGHRSLTGRSKIDGLIEAAAFGLSVGLSSSWYSTHHRTHHAMPQRLDRDSDLETLPLLAFNKYVVQNPKKNTGKLSKIFIKYQVFLFLTVDTSLVGLFWKFYLHPKYVIERAKYFELFCMTCHYILAYNSIGLIPYLISAWLGSMCLLGNTALSHLHLPLATKGPLHWVEYALAHTTDIEPSWWCDWWMGYLNYQIEHHLFPSIPNYKNHLVTARVKELALKHNIPYYCCSYKDAVVNCHQNLLHVSQSVEHDM